mmetsp:Transcript_3522/g.6785  ORF Transcript_3522/g.6785 Transcript_3522/m.6785 type:complete len:324 (+) Transcript_3522:93-1064(+)
MTISTEQTISHIEGNTQAFLNALSEAGGPPIYTLTPAEARQVLRGAQSRPIDAPAVDVEDRVIEGGDIGQVVVTVTRPKDSKETLPVVVYMHGGGWILGDKDTHERLVREIAVGANVAVVFPNYTPSPEARYPVAIEQCYAALKWVTERGADEINVDGLRLAVMGDSVGGNMSAALTLMAKERQGPSIKFQVLLYPVTDANFETGSYNEFSEGPWLTKTAMKWFWDAYLPDLETRREITACPLQATVEQLKGLPPALVVTDENDVLRDEGEAYAHKLSAAGVRVTTSRYLGTIHDFCMLNALAETPAARGAISQSIQALKENI